LTVDRFGNVGKAYSFDGVSNYILVPSNNSLNSNSISVSGWFNLGVLTNNIQGLVSRWNQLNNPCYNFSASIDLVSKFTGACTQYPSTVLYSNSLESGIWIHFTYVHDANTGGKIYLNGNLVNFNNTLGSICSSSNNLIFGAQNNLSNSSFFRYLNGRIDDIGIWNRALSECEVTDLYNTQLGSFSNVTVSINPISSAIGSNATISVSTPIQSVQWQSNPSNIGWVNLSDNSNYNGVNNDTLDVANLQLSNHNQPFRVLACGDTSNIATIQIADTCITNVTVYDTLLTTVTDTLIINTTLSLPAPNNENTILIYPNPASDHITIDNGNYTAMVGYTIKIENNAGQQVFQSLINQAQFYVDLSTWSGDGLYFVHLIDAQGNTVTVRKIVLQ
jgi:hypothetical protein